MIEIATRETMKTTPAAAEPAIRGSCSLSSDLKSSVSHKEKGRQTDIVKSLGGAPGARLRLFGSVHVSVCLGGTGRHREKKRRSGLGVLMDKENI